MEIVLEVPDKDAARVLELVKGIKRVKIKSSKPAPTAASEQFLSGLAEAIEDVKRHLRGELELQSWDDLYAELKAEDTGVADTKNPASSQPISNYSSFANSVQSRDAIFCVLSLLSRRKTQNIASLLCILTQNLL